MTIESAINLLTHIGIEALASYGLAVIIGGGASLIINQIKKHKGEKKKVREERTSKYILVVFIINFTFLLFRDAATLANGVQPW